MGSVRNHNEEWASRLTRPEDREKEATINAIVEIAAMSGFECEDNTSGVDLTFGYRDDSDAGDDEAPSLAARQRARHVAREILAAYPTATVELEAVDEWISMLVTLPGHKPRYRRGLGLSHAV